MESPTLSLYLFEPIIITAHTEQPKPEDSSSQLNAWERPVLMRLDFGTAEGVNAFGDEPNLGSNDIDGDFAS